jgi:hypothetical protein
VEQQPQQQATKVDGQPPDEEESESESSSERSSQPRYRREASVPRVPTSPGDESPMEEDLGKIGTEATETMKLIAALEKTAALKEEFIKKFAAAKPSAKRKDIRCLERIAAFDKTKVAPSSFVKAVAAPCVCDAKEGTLG